jgi:glycosyltransferase involved in cell wall biosynthesis
MQIARPSNLTCPNHLARSSHLRVLLIAEQCNPDWFSVPLEAWNYYEQLKDRVDITLVTHERNREALEKVPDLSNIVYIAESKAVCAYYSFVNLVAAIAFKGKTNWPLMNAICYPVYEEFNQKVYQLFKSSVLGGEFDVVHVLTPMMPRYPAKIIKACQKTPFLLGPVNGGVPFPKGFQEKAKEEFAYFNFLRAIGRYLIPGYVETYKKADKILAGSSYTLGLIKDLFKLGDDKVTLFYENGIPKSFLSQPKSPQPKSPNKTDTINLIFVGRLVPYKCADIVIEAIGRLDEATRSKVSLSIVGDGSERQKLEAIAETLHLGNTVNFLGWVEHEKTLEYYRQSDIFCFPSIREFGGAVVLEAMACGLPCIVANNGGIGEYVTDQTGFRIEPISREFLTQAFADKLKILVEDAALRAEMSANAIARAQEFEWSEKAKKIVEIYHQLIAVSSTQPSEIKLDQVATVP